MPADEVLLVTLMVESATIGIGISMKKNMWPMVVIYWTTVFIRYAMSL